jgi:hypothetical protein
MTYKLDPLEAISKFIWKKNDRPGSFMTFCQNIINTHNVVYKYRGNEKEITNISPVHCHLKHEKH